LRRKRKTTRGMEQGDACTQARRGSPLRIGRMRRIRCTPAGNGGGSGATVRDARGRRRRHGLRRRRTPRTGSVPARPPPPCTAVTGDLCVRRRNGERHALCDRHMKANAASLALARGLHPSNGSQLHGTAPGLAHVCTGTAETELGLTAATSAPGPLHICARTERANGVCRSGCIGARLAAHRKERRVDQSIAQHAERRAACATHAAALHGTAAGLLGYSVVL
jgi:hypothetical protein